MAPPPGLIRVKDLIFLQVMPITLNPNVQSLILKHNKFKSVDASISFYPALKYLDLSHNRIEIIDLFHLKLQSGISQELRIVRS